MCSVTVTLTSMAVLQLMPGHPGVLIFYIDAGGRIQSIFFHIDISFSQGTFQLVKASIGTFCNKSLMKVRANKMVAITGGILKMSVSFRGTL